MIVTDEPNNLNALINGALLGHKKNTHFGNCSEEKDYELLHVSYH